MSEANSSAGGDIDTEIEMVVQKYGRRFGCYSHPTNGTVLRCGHSRRFVQGSEPCITCVVRFLK